MKTQWIAALLAVVILLSLTGCSAANAVQKLDAAEDKVESKLDAVEDKLEDSLRKSVGTPPVAAEPAQAMSPAAENAQMLTQEQALQIALDYLGFTADQITRQRMGYEIDDGIPQFDIEFHQGDWEYEFEIHAENGKIISFDKDHKHD